MAWGDKYEESLMIYAYANLVKKVCILREEDV